MLSGSIKLNGKYDYLKGKFDIGLKWLAETDTKSLTVGKHEIPNSDLIANVQEYATKPESECRFEAHSEHFDIQYIAEGREFFGVCSREGLTIIESHPERDTGFFADPENYGCVLLNAGDYIIVSPEEAHKPTMAVGKPEHVKKVVIKIKV